MSVSYDTHSRPCIAQDNPSLHSIGASHWSGIISSAFGDDLRKCASVRIHCNTFDRGSVKRDHQRRRLFLINLCCVRSKEAKGNLGAAPNIVTGAGAQPRRPSAAHELSASASLVAFYDLCHEIFWTRPGTNSMSESPLLLRVGHYRRWLCQTNVAARAGCC